MLTKTTIIIHIVVFYYVVLLALFIYIFIHKALNFLVWPTYYSLPRKARITKERWPSNIHYTTLQQHTQSIAINEKEQAGRRRKEEEEGGKTRKEERGRREEVENNEEEGEEEGGKEAKE